MFNTHTKCPCHALYKQYFFNFFTSFIDNDSPPDQYESIIFAFELFNNFGHGELIIFNE